MNYASIKKLDIANGPGIRVSLFVSGCTHHCKNCFNPETWDFNYGRLFTSATEEELFEALRLPHVQGLTILGGEPFEPSNQRCLLPFVRRFKERFCDKDIWCYSGYLLEEIKNGRAHCECSDELLSYLDVLVDGPFVEAYKDISLPFRGSSNQRLIDVQQTLRQKKNNYMEYRRKSAIMI